MAQVQRVLSINHDGKLTLAVGKNRFDTKWKNTDTSWSALLKRLETARPTGETAAEYKDMSKSDRDSKKDVGGFVGGTLKGGRRISGSVAWRHLVTLDADYPPLDFWDRAAIILDGVAAACYSTHSHTPDKPRLRLVIPLARPVTPDEYSAISRHLAGDLGIDYFDDSTYELERLMYWPSKSIDAEYIFRYTDEPWLDPDEVLARYENWKDPSYWPESSRETGKRKRMVDKAEDPLAKGGAVGAFCRAWPIEDAINNFLSEIYEPCDIQGRYTYRQGSTAGGLVIYEGKFAYSHHGTDPASGKLLNAFDLVRLHLFGDRDAEIDPATPISKLPSNKAMTDLAIKDPLTKIELATRRRDEAGEAFADDEKPDGWKALLAMSDKGIRSTIDNAVVVLENDPKLKGKIRMNTFAHRPEITGSLPWRTLEKDETGVWADSDDAQLRHYMEREHSITGISKIFDAVNVVLEKNAYHPVRDYLNKLEWDELDRVDALLIDWLGAADTPYVRAVTRKTLMGAVARIMKPGVKFDYMLTLTGPQGIGKSSLLMKLAGKWFSDSLTSVDGKDAYEQLQGRWILELGELTATKKSEVESIKLFLSKQIDTFRMAYGRRSQEYPRQCIFIGTTNDRDFLRDRTGNRRYWPVSVGVTEPRSGSWSEITQEYVDQVWAEAVHHYRKGEALYLDDTELAEAALQEQAEMTEDTGKIGLISCYLDKLLPETWPAMGLADRRAFLSGQASDFVADGTVQRARVCVAEIFDECLGRPVASARGIEVREIHDVMRALTGWKSIGKQRFPDPYGIQRAYERVAELDQ